MNQEIRIGPFFSDVMTGVALSMSYFVRLCCWLALAQAGRGWLLVCFTTNVWLKTFPHLHYRSSFCSQMVCQRHLADQSKAIGGSYHSFINGGTIPCINNYEKLNISLPKFMTLHHKITCFVDYQYLVVCIFIEREVFAIKRINLLPGNKHLSLAWQFLA